MRARSGSLTSEPASGKGVMRTSTRRLITAVVGLAPVLTCGFMSGFEKPQVLSASKVLPKGARSGEGYVVADDVHADGFAHRFTIRSEAFGQFTATGEYMLHVRILEIRALRALAEIGTGEAYGKALKKAGTAPVTLAKNLVTDPVDTAKAVPKGIGKAAKKAGGWLAGDRRKRSETEDGATHEAIGFSRRKRELARKLQVDPFSSNEQLQEELDRVAWASFAGGMTLSAAFAAVALPPVFEMTYRVSGLQATTHDLVTSMSGGDLHRRNRKILNEMGVDPEATEAFLNNPHLSPYHKTAITVALQQMKGVSGRDKVVGAGIDVGSEEEAVRLQRAAQLAAGYHANVAPLRSAVRAGSEILLYTTADRLVSASSADRLLWTQETQDLAEAMRGWAPEGSPVRKREIWITGVFSDRARDELDDRGFALHERAGEKLE